MSTCTSKVSKIMDFIPKQWVFSMEPCTTPCRPYGARVAPLLELQMDGHGILVGGHFMAPTKIITWDPCPLGFREILSRAHGELL